MTIPNLKINQEITAVSKGIRHSTYGNTTWIDQEVLGNTIFLKITKIGTKYIYGNLIYFEENGQKRYDWEDKIDTTEYLILNGIRQDLHTKHLLFRKTLNEYEDSQRKAQYNADSEARKVSQAIMNHWKIDHPKPENKIEDYQC